MTTLSKLAKWIPVLMILMILVLTAFLIAFIADVVAFENDRERDELRDHAREYVDRRALNVDSDRLLHDPNVLADAYYRWTDRYPHDEMHLAGGDYIPTATRIEWEQARWRVELRSDESDAVVCAVIPERSGDAVIVTNGSCGAAR